ncbi:MAG TPA: lysylphosphatidylglycerol synthase transmembrane domain-containing protein [Jatrophihabitans sp.]|nr:lysylphosphatidylglycerol synthase transmembrane domain-containing protein [Jatrophihabitans sp.]
MALPAWLRRHPVRWSLLVAILVVAGLFLAPRTSQALQSVHRLGGADWGWLSVALGAEIASLIAFSLVTWTLLVPGARPRFWRVLRLDLVTVALSHSVPVGSAAGTALGFELLTEEGVDPVQAGFVKVSQSLLSGVLLEVLLAGSLFARLVFYGPSADAVALAGAGGALLVLVAGFAGLLAYRPSSIQKGAGALLGRLPRVEPDDVVRVIGELSERLRELIRTPVRLGWACVWSLGHWLFDLLSLWAALRAFGAPPSGVLLTVAFCVAQVAASLLISPAGLGVVESSLIPLLEGFGTSAEVAVLGVLSWRLLNFWLPLPVGGLAYLGILDSRRRRPPRTEPAPPAPAA